jgi:hypothetical protein
MNFPSAKKCSGAIWQNEHSLRGRPMCIRDQDARRFFPKRLDVFLFVSIPLSRLLGYHAGPFQAESARGFCGIPTPERPRELGPGARRRRVTRGRGRGAPTPESDPRGSSMVGSAAAESGKASSGGGRGSGQRRSDPHARVGNSAAENGHTSWAESWGSGDATRARGSRARATKSARTRELMRQGSPTKEQLSGRSCHTTTAPTLTGSTAASSSSSGRRFSRMSVRIVNSLTLTNLSENLASLLCN